MIQVFHRPTWDRQAFAVGIVFVPQTDRSVGNDAAEQECECHIHSCLFAVASITIIITVCLLS
jgi:hypothetical protein